MEEKAGVPAAIRFKTEEGFYNAYLQLPTGDVKMGSLAIGAVTADPALRDEFVTLMKHVVKKCLSDILPLEQGDIVFGDEMMDNQEYNHGYDGLKN